MTTFGYDISKLAIERYPKMAFEADPEQMVECALHLAFVLGGMLAIANKAYGTEGMLALAEKFMDRALDTAADIKAKAAALGPSTRTHQ